MSFRIDDFRVWQDQTQKTDMHEIIRQLVREPRQVRLTVPLRPPQVVLAHFLEFIVFESRQDPRVHLAIFAVCAGCPGHSAQVRQFVCAFDVRVTRENLLDQR